jgi:hypothetical protein
LVAAAGEGVDHKAAHHREAFERISSVLGELSGHAPARDETLRFAWPPKGTLLEARMQDGKSHPKTIFRILFESALQWAAHRFGLTFGDYNGPAYQSGLKQSTDYQRFDDMIRLVLDCTPAEVDQLVAVLDELEGQGRIYYGLHAAPQALMTCLLFDLPTSKRIHFLDADEGGFTLAARQLKAKMI